MRHGFTTGVLACALALAAGAAVAARAQEAKSPTQASAKATAAAVNLNTASSAQLQELPGIGPRTAELIIQYREKNGGFKKIEELMNVKGIGEKSFLKLKDRIVVTPAQPARAGQ